MTNTTLGTRLIAARLLAAAFAAMVAASACNSGVFDQDVEAIEARIAPECEKICDGMEQAGCNSSTQANCPAACENRLTAALLGDQAGCVTAVEAFLDCCPKELAARCARDSLARVEDCNCAGTSNVGDCASGMP
jgi:hypothetical protein